MSAIVRSITPKTVGDTLNFLLTSKDPYKKYTNIDLKKADFKIQKLIESYITEVYNKYFNIPFSLNVRYVSTSTLLPGDVVSIGYRHYIVTQNIGDRYVTWPRALNDDKEYFNEGINIKTYQVIRPDLSNTGNKTLEAINSISREALLSDPEFQDRFTEDSKLFNADRSVSNLGDGFLQIGDLIFLVDPTQLSFNTQNGYQYFPTIRTAGNPKIPSMQQIKNVSISLIFPNEDSINYQLLNLYAMYKRAPFVNIRNKDICGFFQEICFGNEWPHQWLSVGLESIQIQSVEGFPNTLQANITILPFDHRIISNGFSALKSMKDVKIQQAILYRNKDLDNLIRKSEAKLNEQSVVLERFLDVIAEDVQKSPDFRESLPFRAFYQSLINGREYVRNSTGEIAAVSSSTNKEENTGYSIVKYRPKDKTVMLNEYKAESNQNKIILSYKYLNGDFRDIQKQISKQRTDYQDRTIRELNRIKDTINTKEGMISEVISSLYTTEDFFKQINYSMQQKVNTTRELLARYEITIDEEEADFKPIDSLTSLIWRGFLQNTGIEEFSATIRDANRFRKGKFSVDNQNNPLGLSSGSIYNQIDGVGIDNSNAVITAQQSLDKIWDYIEKNPGMSEKFSAFLHDMRLNILKELGQSNTETIISPDPNSPDGFKVFSLPILNEIIEIDNISDIITGWSLIFANKFVPLTLQAYKYPYYQHIGSEDAVISLNIVSTSEKKLQDFKSKLSLLSERLYETVKTITLTAPELLTYLDSRITVDVSPNNIFKVFGINKVVFDNSTTSNINGQPNVWNTTLSLTQANFTIDQYHSIDSIPSNNNVTELIAKVAAGIEYYKEQDTFNVKKYEVRSNPVILESQDSPNWVPASLDEIIKFRFIDSKWGNKLLNYIKEIKTKGEKYIAGRTPKQISGGSSITGLTYSTGTAPTDVIRGEELADSFDNTMGLLKTHRDSYDAKKHFAQVEIDIEVTNAINSLAAEYPEFREILKFLVIKIDSIFEQQYNSLITILQPQRSFFQSFIESISSNLSGSAINTWAVISLFAVVFGVASVATGGLAIPTFISAFISLNIAGVGIIGADTLIDASKEAGFNKIINSFQGFFANVMENYNNSVILDFANKIYKDPVIKKKLLNEKIIGKSGVEELERTISNSIVNCYKDFDVPYLDNNLTLSPDFYLYNNILNDYELLTYITESTERYLKIGKLGLMMTMVEAEEALTTYDNLIKQNQEIDKNIKQNVDNIVYSETFGEDINSVITTLQNTQIQLARSSEIEDMNLSNELDQIAEWEKIYPREEAADKQGWDNLKYATFEHYKISKKGLTVNDLQSKKLNLIYTARMKTIIEIFQVYTIINKYMIDTRIPVSSTKNFFTERAFTKNQDNLLNLTKNESEEYSIKLLYEHITTVLNNASNLTSQTLQDGTFGSKTNTDKAIINSLKQKVGENNGTASTVNTKFLSLPDIKNLQSFLYNKIGYYIRLNTFLNEYAKSPTPTLDFSKLPELRFLDFWNFRSIEENERKVILLKEFYNGYNNKKDTTIKMFPTFKLFFLEEDKGIFRNYDDYYSHNAIQSIEIVTNKNSASTTAVIRLSNINNSLTDQMSFMRERAEILGVSVSPGKEPDNLFFGSLDIKPGTPIVIKLGYAPFDNLLTTVFQGRIIEMNPGPMVEMVCQSYGAQLNHNIISQKFGMLSTVREHGDVASSILDMIPGLEKLGKISMFGLNTGDFSGKNLRNIRGKFMDKFLLGNILGNISSMLFAQDNPRDENIFLPYSFTSNIGTHPTFDWVVFDQSVWEAIQEITLYHRNVIATLRNFNSDPISNRGDLRETLVIGDKGGFYKFTDAFSLTNLNFRDVNKAIEQWAKVQEILLRPVIPFTSKPTPLYLKDEYKNIFAFLQNELNALVLTSIIIQNNSAVEANPDLLDSVIDMLRINRIFPDKVSTSVADIIAFSKFLDIKEENLTSTNFSSGENLKSTNIFVSAATSSAGNESLTVNSYKYELNEVGVAFKKAMTSLQDLLLEGKLPTNITNELFYQVKAQIINTSESLINNPQYKKIQQQHLISDTGDIISNNIALNIQFANMVNVYYTGEPKIKTSNINVIDVNKDLSIWPVKAFGDTRDEHTRVLNSYQKNIDTNWFDVARASSNFFKSYAGYSRKSNNEGKLAEYLKSIGITSFTENIPRWETFPSFVVVGVSLLKRQVETMYQGTLEIVGNPDIQPYDIIHLQDYTNDMHGAFEVEEVIHTFTPERGFRTVITPNLITYDRDPIQAQDIQIINQIYDFANARRSQSIIAGVAGAGLSAIVGVAASSISAPIIGTLGATAGAGIALWNGIVGSYKRHHKFLYDQMGNILGRDCINFTSLLYHGVPFMAGFEGVDYTNLKTLINHSVMGVKNPIARYAAFSDPLAASIITNFNPDEFSLLDSFTSRIPIIGGLISPITGNNLKVGL